MPGVPALTGLFLAGPRHDGSIEKVFKDLNSHMVELVRVKNSLFPVSYGILLEFFAFVYLVAFPLALLETFGFWVIPSALCMGCVYNVLIGSFMSIYLLFRFPSQLTSTAA